MLGPKKNPTRPIFFFTRPQKKTTRRAWLISAVTLWMPDRAFRQAQPSGHMADFTFLIQKLGYFLACAVPPPKGAYRDINFGSPNITASDEFRPEFFTNRKRAIRSLRKRGSFPKVVAIFCFLFSFSNVRSAPPPCIVAAEFRPETPPIDAARLAECTFRTRNLLVTL